MSQPSMSHLTSQTDSSLQEFEIVFIPIDQAEPVERKGVPQRDAYGNPIRKPKSDEDAGLVDPQ
jgi:hypothetical protein